MSVRFLFFVWFTVAAYVSDFIVFSLLQINGYVCSYLISGGWFLYAVKRIVQIQKTEDVLVRANIISLYCREISILRKV